MTALLSGACATEEDAPKDARRAESYGTGIVSMETVQRSMALHNPPAAAAPAPAPAAAPVEADTPKSQVPAAPRPRPRAQSQGHAPTRVTAGSPAASPALTPAPAPMPAAAPVAPAVAEPVPAAPEMPATAPRMNALQFAEEQSPIYTQDDEDVIPARLLTAQNGKERDASITDVNSMELVISKLGRVEQAKMSAPPKRMTDMVLLSSAKTWKFAPAMKNGQPVRYRTIYTWETTR
jgi:hypothetical protein